MAATIALPFVLVALEQAGSSAGARPRCATAVIEDWSDGRVDGVYQARCYRDALDSLPEDLANYSTASDDIHRALLNRLARRSSRPSSSAASRQLSGRDQTLVTGQGRETEDETAPHGWLLTRLDPLPAPLVLMAALLVGCGLVASATLVTRRLLGTRSPRGGSGAKDDGGPA